MKNEERKDVLRSGGDGVRCVKHPRALAFPSSLPFAEVHEPGLAFAYAYDELITVSGLMPITPEELERAIGAAFAADMQY